VSTKKQRKELEDRLNEWVFTAIDEMWSTSDILTTVGKDWSNIVGATSRGVDIKGLAEWQGKVLELAGVGTNPEVAASVTQSVLTEVVGAVQEAFEEFPADTVTRAIGDSVVEKLLTETEASSLAGVDVDEIRTPTGALNLDLAVIVDVAPEVASVHTPSQVEVVDPNASPNAIPMSFLRRSALAGAGAVALAGALSLGGIAPTSVSYAYASDSNSSSAYSRAVGEPQSMIVASSVSGATERDGVSVLEAPRVSGTVVRPVSVDVSGIGGNSALVGSALKYLGSGWDCTMLVEQALRDLGYTVGDLAPMEFGQFGTVFYDASAIQPGDIMMRGGHVAIYAGNGMTVQGGFGFGGVVLNSWEGPANYSAFVRVG
jgi:cell wall-associated NlpC family hydrolase